MEVRPHGHGHGHGQEDQIPSSAQEEDHHHHPPPHEKIKSVLNKVKDKAKRIKNTLTKHGHDHDSSSAMVEEDEEEEEEEDDDGDVKIAHQMEKKQSSVVDEEREKNEDGEIKVPKLKRESVVKDIDDPNSSKSNLLPPNYYQSTETGAGITSSFNKMNINAVEELKDEQHNQPKSPDQKQNTGQKKLTVLMAEKMSPGEEDKALSETISDALEWRKKKEGEKEKVTVSEELEKRLGSCDDYQNRRPSGSDAEGKLPGVSETMVDRIKGTVGSWLGLRSGGGNGADQSHAASLGTTTTNIMAGGGGSGNVNDNENVGRQRRQGE